MRFTGFPEIALVFYEGLEADNSKTYWTAHKPVYDEQVRAPMQALLDDLEPEFGAAKLYRPFRDVRFSKDKTPYKSAVAASVGQYYVQLTADGLMVGGGIYHTAPDQVVRLRRAVDDDVQGAQLERLVADLRGRKWSVDGERLATKPRGFSADHPRIDLLRYKSMIAFQHWEPAVWLHTAKAGTRVRDAWRELGDITAWLSAHVGPSSEQRRR